MTIANKQMSDQQLIRGILGRPEFKKLQNIGIKLQKENSCFDMLTLFNDVLVENSWSHLFAYLFRSEENHRLGQRFFRTWFQFASDSHPELANYQNGLPDVDNSQTIVSLPWPTPNGRFLDILVEIRSKIDDRVFVVGIENKVASGEQRDQLKDYQRALIEEFRYSPKVIIFLTPDGRESQTSDNCSDCPCFAVPYKSIISTCKTILPECEGQAEILIKVLKTHISRMVGVNDMEKKIKSLIYQLYKKPNHRRAIELINLYTPNITFVFEPLEKYFGNLPNQKVTLPMRNRKALAWFWHRNEFNVQFKELDGISSNKGIHVSYMLKFPNESPVIGDRFTLRIMVNILDKQNFPDRDRNRVKKTIKSSMQLSERSNGQDWDWGPWVSIWVGDSYELRDMGSKDVEGLKNLLFATICKTYPELKKKLIAFSRAR